MRILCLHGRGTNADVLKTQLAPVIYELGKTQDLDFYFVNSPFEAPPMLDITDHYEGPFYGLFDEELPHYAQWASRAREIRRRNLAPEDHCRAVRDEAKDLNSSAACDFVSELVQQNLERPFDGVLGFSEGACVAASYIFRQATENHCPFKFAIFICGTPPYDWRRNLSILADETSWRMDIPTAHIVGSKDLGYKLSLALFNLSNQNTARIFDHGGPHGIPWNAAATKGIDQTICGVIEQIESDVQRATPPP